MLIESKPVHCSAEFLMHSSVATASAPIWAGSSFIAVLTALVFLEASRILLHPPSHLQLMENPETMEWREVERDSERVAKRFRLGCVHLDPRLPVCKASPRFVGQCLRFPKLHLTGALLWPACILLSWMSPLCPDMEVLSWAALSLQEMYASFADPLWWAATALNICACYCALSLLLNVVSGNASVVPPSSSWPPPFNGMRRSPTCGSLPWRHTSTT